jgi:hypothetical protein
MGPSPSPPPSPTRIAQALLVEAVLDHRLRLQQRLAVKDKARSPSHWFPYDRVRVVNAIP